MQSTAREVRTPDVCAKVLSIFATIDIVCVDHYWLVSFVGLTVAIYWYYHNISTNSLNITYEYEYVRFIYIRTRIMYILCYITIRSCVLWSCARIVKNAKQNESARGEDGDDDRDPETGPRQAPSNQYLCCDQ